MSLILSLRHGAQDADFFIAFSAVPPDFHVPCEDEAPVPPPPSPPPPPPVCTSFTGLDISLAYAQLAHNNVNRRGPHQWNDATDPEGMRFVNIGQLGDFYVVRTARLDPDPSSLHHHCLYPHDNPSTPPPARPPPPKISLATSMSLLQRHKAAQFRVPVSSAADNVARPHGSLLPQDLLLEGTNPTEYLTDLDLEISNNAGNRWTTSSELWTSM